MTSVEVNSKVTVKINAYTFELTRAEAQHLLDSLKRELGDASKSNYPWFQLGGPNIASPARDILQVGIPAYVPSSPNPPGTVIC